MANKHTFDEDTARIVLPKPVPEVMEDDRKNADADSSFDELEIEVDDDEVSAEEPEKHPARKN